MVASKLRKGIAPLGLRRRRWMSLLLVGCMLVAGGAACDSGDRPDKVEEPAITTIPVVHTGAEIVLPLDAYLADDATQQSISAALNILVRRCVEGFGLEFPVSLGGGSSAAAGLDNSRRYFVFEEAVAQKDGYHISQQQREEIDRVSTERAANRGKQLSSEVQNIVEGKGPTVFNGKPVPQGGCGREAATKLGGNKASTASVNVQGLRLESYSRMLADSRVAAVNALWSKCMKEQGFDYPDTKSANDDRRWSADEPTKLEIDTAVADAKCKREHNVVGIMLTVETAYQKRIIDQKITELNEIKEFYAVQATNAAQVIAGGK